ncbi:DMT family transporter [Paenibacillus sp. CAU 1782]
MNNKATVAGHAAAIITILIWGTTFVSTKVLLAYLGPVEILVARFALGWLALYLVFPRRLKVGEPKKELYFAAAGLCGVTLYFLLENIALTYSFTSNISVILSTSPFTTALLSFWIGDGEKPGRRFFIGFAIAIIGVFLISFSGSTELRIHPIGDLLAVLAALVWSIYSVLVKKINGFGYHAIQSTRRIFMYGLLLMTPILLWSGFHWDGGSLLQPIPLGNLFFLGLGASALCFVTWGKAVQLLGVVRTSAYIYTVPVIAIITALMILGEKITLMSAIGAALAIGGLLVSQVKWRRAAANNRNVEAKPEPGV